MLVDPWSVLAVPLGCIRAVFAPDSAEGSSTGTSASSWDPRADITEAVTYTVLGT